MHGAGHIGRGFIGKVFSESGYDACFVDVSMPVVDQLNKDNEYPVKIVNNGINEEHIVKNVYAVNGFDIERVADEILNADIMATAVGVNMLSKIVKPICEGLKKRYDLKKDPLSIIICKNLIDADQYLRKLIEEEMGEFYKAWLDNNLGLVEASIGRMVPVMTDEMREGNILKVWVEPYDELPVDQAAFIGEIPKLNNLLPFSPFGFYIKRKLFIHNMGHAMCAYFGWQKGYTMIDECILDDEIKAEVESAMKESASALHKEYGMDINFIHEHVDDLMIRFGNKTLGDTIERVGKDPIRKLGYNDRLVGAALYCQSQGATPTSIISGIATGLSYNNPNDEASVKIQNMIKGKGVDDVIIDICIGKKNVLFKQIKRRFEISKVQQ